MSSKTNSRPHIAILINEKSGKGSINTLQSIKSKATQLGWSGSIEPVQEATSLADQIAVLGKQGVSRFVVGGGDGTIRQVAQCLHGTSCELAILPLGTGNLLAINLGIPLNRDQALELALTGQAKPLDCATLDNDLFLIGAGLGLDAKVMADVTTERKNKLGVLAYVLSAVRYMSDRSHKFQVTFDNQPSQTYKAKMILASNLGKIQAGIQVAPAATPDASTLNIAIVEANSITEWLSLLGWLIRNHPQHSPSYHSFSAKQIVIETIGESVPYQCDGDNMGSTTKVEIKMAPQAISIVY